MGFWDWAGRVLGVPRVQFSESAPRPIDQMFAELAGRSIGQRVTREQALTVPAVQQGRNLICSIATLPLQQLNSANTVVRNPLLEQIDPNVANVVTLAQTFEDLLFESISWWRVTALGFDGFPSSAEHLDVSRVSLVPPSDGAARSPLPGGDDPRGAVVWVDGKPVPWSEVIRFDSPNPAVLKVAGRAIRRALLLDQLASMYADDPRPLDYFTPTDMIDPVDDDEVREILNDWRAARKSGSTAYVPAALAYHTVDTPTPADLQLVQLQAKASLDLSNALGIDPEDLGVSTTSRTYANAVDRRRDRINDTLSPFMRAITDRLSMPDVTKRGYRVAFDLDDYMKANPTERWGVYEKALNLGVMTVAEVRAEEGLSAGGGPAAPDTAAEVADEQSVAAAARQVAATFDDERLQFADVPVTGFTADAGKRTIEGLVLPYGKIGAKYGLKFRFERGALTWSDASRVKLLRDHDFAQALGKAVTLTDTPAGLKVRFSVGRGPEGDRALEAAEDGVLDGFSVGVDFDLAADAVPDPRNKGALLVRRADLREVSLTAMPAFDDARVTKVAASRDGGTMEKCATCSTEHAPGVACPTPAPTPPAATGLTLNSDQLATLLGQPNGAAALGAMLGVTPTVAEQRAVVDPTKLGGAVTLVTDPAPYRFDSRGNLQRGTHDFSQDLFAGHAGDTAALARATEFVRATFDIATGDVNELNPTRQRPELYVDQRDFQYPIWDSINKGTLTDITPFTFPKFSSASGLVGAHTEGVEPSSGTLVTTSQTVTPTAVSGKAKITRETWDQGGNPQVSNLIWRQMTKGWFEALEAAAVAVLDAATPTAITLTAGEEDTDLTDELEAALTLLQFIRGGFSMDTAFTQVDLYKKLAAAVDTAGRKIYPALGPANATGTVRPRWAGIDVNGLAFLPAWALAATGVVPASSYLFDRAVVHGWASAPQRLDFNIEVAHVYIGLWGYKATAISDVTGVREIIYDPVA